MPEKTSNRRATGKRYEDFTAAWLAEQGFEILERNFSCRMGEIDIIAREKGTLVFIEVKFRVSLSCGFSEDAVNPAKQRKIRRVAEYYLTGHPWEAESDCRFDVAAFENGRLHYYRDAYGGM